MSIYELCSCRVDGSVSWCALSTLALILSASSFMEFLESLGKGFDKDIPFSAEYYKVSHSLNNISLYLSPFASGECISYNS